MTQIVCGTPIAFPSSIENPMVPNDGHWVRYLEFYRPRGTARCGLILSAHVPGLSQRALVASRDAWPVRGGKAHARENSGKQPNELPPWAL